MRTTSAGRDSDPARLHPLAADPSSGLPDRRPARARAGPVRRREALPRLPAVMDAEEQAQQEALHAALAQLIPDLGEGDVLTGWLVVFEHQTAGDIPSCGHIYGPSGMTTWRAMGLCEWARTVTLRPDDEEEEI